MILKLSEAKGLADKSSEIISGMQNNNASLELMKKLYQKAQESADRKKDFEEDTTFNL